MNICMKDAEMKIGLFFVKTGVNAFAKTIDSRQPAQSAQADIGRNFSL